MEYIWVKIAIIVVIGIVVYREIIKAAHAQAKRTERSSKAGFIHLLTYGAAVGVFTYVGMTLTWIETRDLRPYPVPASSQMVSIFDPGVIEVNGMVIKTNLAAEGALKSLSEKLVQECGGNDGCEAQKLFDYVTALPYRTDHTSRHALEVVRSGWGDCDDKSNLYASLLNERGIDYLLVYVPQHVFMAVHVKDDSDLPILKAYLNKDGKKYYFAETTATGARLGEFNGQFPSSFEGIYDLKLDQEINKDEVSFRMI